MLRILLFYRCYVVTFEAPVQLSFYRCYVKLKLRCSCHFKTVDRYVNKLNITDFLSPTQQTNLRNPYSSFCFSKYFNLSEGFGMIVSAPGFQPAGHTSPCASVYLKACTNLSVSSTLLPTGKSFIVI